MAEDTTRTEWRAPSGHAGISLSRLPGWVIPVVAIVIAIAAAWVMDTMQEYAIQDRKAQTVLIAIEEDSAQQQIIQDEAVGEREVTPETTRALAEERREVRQALNRLESLNVAGEDIARLRQTLNNIQATVDEQLDLIEAGKFEQVESLEEERVDSSFEELDDVAEDVGATAEASALRTESIAGVGIYLITFLTTIALMAMYRLYQRRARANQRELLESEERYRLVAQATNEVIWDYDLRTQGQMWDGATEAMFGYAPEEMGVTGEWWEDHIHPDDRERVLANTKAVPRDGREAWIEEYRFRRADSAYVTVVDRAYVVRDAEDRPVRMLGSIMDVTERKRAEEALREAEERYRTLVERIPVVTYIQELSSPGRVIYISPQNESIKGYSTEEVLSVSEHWLKILHPDDRERVLAEDERTNRTGEPFVMEYRQIARDGSVVWVRDEATLVHNEEGEPLYWLGIQTDVTERKALEERLEHQALHDPLTDLPNRRLFVDRLGQALRRTRRRGRGVAVLFMDLDGFKNINDSLGHETGDDLLVAVAERLGRCLRPEDTLARFGGDEFVVLLEDAESPDEPVRVAERITRELGGPFVLGGNELYVGASIGVAMGGERTRDPGDLLRDADLAMYRAKEEGSGYSVFDPDMHDQAASRLELENDLRHALEREEFTVYYQPRFRLGQPDRIEQVEALVRWEHPQRGFMLPDDFLPLAQEMGLIIPIDGWVMKEACRQAKDWQERYPSEPPLSVGVNLSAGQVRHPGLLHEVRSAFRESGLAPGNLILEITEGTLLKDTQEIETVFKELKALGVRLEIDDFGKEYSSLSYLNRLPVDGLKIDRLFLESFGENPSNMLIVEAVISLAHRLGLEVAGEGVQSAEQLELLRGMGCDFVQGCHLARPRPKEEVERLLAHRMTSRAPTGTQA